MSIHLSKIHMKNNDWKERLNVVYSTNPDFKYESVEEEAVETLDKKLLLSGKTPKSIKILPEAP